MIHINSALCEITNRIRLLMLKFGYAVVDRTWCGKVVQPDFSRLYYVKNGSATITYEQEKLTLSPGHWYLLPAGFSFTYNCADHLEHIYFHIKLCDFDRLDLLHSLNYPRFFESFEDPSKLLCSCLDSKQILDGLKVRQIVYQILLTMIEESGVFMKTREFSPTIERAIQFINQNLSIKLGVGEIAEYVFVSKSTLTKRFKKELGIPVHDYIFNAVMFEAEQLLLKSNLSVLAISERLGFCDQFYFSKLFKKKFGTTPRDHRKNTMA